MGAGWGARGCVAGIGAGRRAAGHSWWATACCADCAVPCAPPASLQVVERILLGWQLACAAPHPGARAAQLSGRLVPADGHLQPLVWLPHLAGWNRTQPASARLLYASTPCTPTEAALAAGQDPIVYPAAGEGGAAAAATSKRGGDEPLAQLQKLALAPLGGAAAHPDDGAKPAAKRGRRSSGAGKRKSAGVAAAAGAGSCQRGMLVVILDELDALLAGAACCELLRDLWL